MTPHHTCSCGTHYDRAEWHNLPLVGVQRGIPEPYELRNCTTCGSTRAHELPKFYALTVEERIAVRALRANKRLARLDRPHDAIQRLVARKWSVGWTRAAIRAGVAS